MAKASNMIPQCLQDAILNIVKHSRDDIECLVGKIQQRLKRSLVVGDEVNFKADDTVMKGEVVIVHDNRPTPVKINLLSKCSGSPSSDKENNFVADNFPGMENMKYSVRMNGKTVCSIPAQALTRINELPTSDGIKKFILSTSKYAAKTPKTPASWTVRQPVRKRKLASSTETSTKKATTCAKAKVPVQQRTLDAFVKIGRLSVSENTKALAKSPAMLNKITPEKSLIPEERKTENKSLGKKGENSGPSKSPRRTPAKKNVIDLSESKSSPKSPRLKEKTTTPCVVNLAKAKIEINRKPASKAADQSSSNANKLPAKNSRSILKTVTPEESEDIIMLKSPGKAGDHMVLPKDSEDIIMLASPGRAQDCTVLPKDGDDIIMLTSPAATLLIVTPVKTGNESKKAIPVLIQQTVTDSEGRTTTSYKQLGRLIEPSKDNGNNKPGKSGSKSGMKQLTLFDLVRAKAPDGSAFDRFATVTPATPKVLRKYRKALKENNAKVQNQCILTAAKEMTEQQRNLLPSPMKSLVRDKKQFLEKRDMLRAMTDEEKKAYYKEKYKHQVQPTKVHQVQISKSEDTVLTDSKLLPIADSVTLPEGLPISSFDDIMFVSGFLMSFKLYLVKPENTRYSDLAFDNLAKYLVTKDAKLEEVVIAMLQTLLNDFTFSEAFEVNVPLKHLTVNKHTVANILYLTFKLTSMKQERSPEETSQLCSLADSIRTSSTCSELSSLILLDCLKMLCILLLDGQGLVQYQEEMQVKLSRCWKERNLLVKTEADFKKEHKDDLAAGDSGKSSLVTNEEPLAPAENLNEVLKLRREMSKRSAEEREKRLAEEKKMKHIAAEKAYLEKQKIVIEDKLKEAMAASKLCKRLSPLGTDRNHSRYWLLPGHQGLYVEKGWTDEYYYLYNISSGARDEDGVMDPADMSTNKVPESCASAWFHYKDKSAVDELVAALNKNGYREGQLKRKVEQNYAQITRVPSTKSESANISEQNYAQITRVPSTKSESANISEDNEAQSKAKSSPIESFKEDLLDLENRVRSAGLGGIENYDEWTKRVEEVSPLSIDILGKCLLDCFAGVYESKRCGVLVLEKNKKSHLFQRKSVTKEEGEGNDIINEEDKKEAKPTSSSVVKWQDGVRNAETISRLYVLMEILDMCVAWEKSVDNAKCRVCKRKGNDATLLLCDGCDLGFHMDCMRMAKKDVPKGDWFCPSCKPPEERNTRNQRSLKDLSDSEESSDEEEEEESSEEEEEEMCSVCNSGGDVAICDTCISAFHVACHQPPLRAVPRFAWTCHTCRFGTKMKKTKRQLDSSIESGSENTDDSAAESSVAKSGRRKADVVVPVSKKAKTGSDANITGAKNTRTTSNGKLTTSDSAPRQRGRPARRSTDVLQGNDDSTDDDDSSSEEEKAAPVRSSRRGSKPALKQETKTISKKRHLPAQGPKSAKRANKDAKGKKEMNNLKAAKSTRQSARASSSQAQSKDSVNDSSDSKTDYESDDEVQLNMSQEQEEISKYISPSKRKNTGKQGGLQLTLVDCFGVKESKTASKVLTQEQLSKNLKTIHNKLWAHKSSWPFENPIDKDEVPDYYDVISEPMDLTTILNNIPDYKSADDFAEDIRKMIFNSFDYNPKESKVAKLTVTFEDYFSSMLGKYLPGTEYRKQQVLFGFSG